MSTETFDELFDSLLEAEASPEQIAELQSMLTDRPALLDEAVQRLAEHRLLSLLYQPSNDGAAADAVMREISHQTVNQVESIMVAALSRRESVQRKLTHRIGRHWLAMVGVPVIVLGLVTWNQWPSADGPGEATQVSDGIAAQQRGNRTPEIATVLLCQNCEWAGGIELREGQRMGVRELQLRSGFAVIRFDGGAEAVMQGAVSLELLSPGSARLNFGDVVVRAPEEAAGFVLTTPSSELRDLGTEFSVRVDRSGATQLDVLEGEVAVRPLESDIQERRVLAAGKAVAVDTAASSPREIASSSKRFSTLLKEAQADGQWHLTYAYAGFHYDEGRLPYSRADAGRGWAGSWRGRTEDEGLRPGQETSNDLDIVHGRMNVTWPVPGGRLGMLRMPTGHAVRLRQMKRPIDLSRDGTYFVSFMLSVPPADEFHRNDDFRVTFRSTADYFGESLSFGVPRNKPLRIQTGLGIGYRSRSPAADNQSMLCVGKIVARRAGEDRAFFRVFSEGETLDCLEPREWDVVARDLDFAARLDLVLITNVGRKERIFDELRIGPTWRSVAPIY